MHGLVSGRLKRGISLAAMATQYFYKMADELVVECITEVRKFFSTQLVRKIKDYKQITSFKALFSELMFFFLSLWALVSVSRTNEMRGS